MDSNPIHNQALYGTGGLPCSCSNCQPTRPVIDPPDREYLVTAILQITVKGRDPVDAMISVKDDLNDLIEQSDFRMDPLNGATIESVVDLAQENL